MNVRLFFLEKKPYATLEVYAVNLLPNPSQRNLWQIVRIITPGDWDLFKKIVHY